VTDRPVVPRSGCAVRRQLLADPDVARAGASDDARGG
jgi:hypothetical protein